MTISTISSREFTRDAGVAKKAAEKGPVVIIDRGRPTHVLLRFEDYEKLLGNGPNLRDALAMPGGEAIEFDPPKLAGRLAPRADFD